PLDFVLDQSCHRPGAESRVIAAFGKPTARAWRELQKHLALIELLVELDDELIHHALDVFLAERIEGDHGIEPITKFRAEHFFYRFFAFAHVRLSAEAKRRAAHFPRPR